MYQITLKGLWVSLLLPSLQLLKLLTYWSWWTFRCTLECLLLGSGQTMTNKETSRNAKRWFFSGKNPELKRRSCRRALCAQQELLWAELSAHVNYQSLMSKTGCAFNKWAEGPKNNMRFWRLNYRQSNCGGGNELFPWGQGTVLAEPGKVPQKGMWSPWPSRCPAFPVGLWGTPCCCSFTAAGFSSPKAAETFHLALGRWQLLQVYLATLVMEAWITVQKISMTEVGMWL